MIATLEARDPEAEVPLTNAKRAAVLGDGGGKPPGPPIRGVRPVRLTSGVNPVRTNELSKAPRPSEGVCCDAGPASIAGDRGPERSEEARPHDPKPWSAGLSRAAKGGNIGFTSLPCLPGPLLALLPFWSFGLIVALLVTDSLLLLPLVPSCFGVS